jgi:hypothetical protein
MVGSGVRHCLYNGGDVAARNRQIVQWRLPKRKKIVVFLLKFNYLARSVRLKIGWLNPHAAMQKTMHPRCANAFNELWNSAKLSVGLIPIKPFSHVAQSQKLAWWTE